MHHHGKDQALVLLHSFQQPGELGQFHWSINQAGTQTIRKQGLEAPTFLSHCTGAALEPLDSWREADGATQTSLVSPAAAQGSRECNREMPTSSTVHIPAIVIYTYASVNTQTHTYVHHKIQSKRAIFLILREICYFYGIKKTAMMITLPQWKPS